MMSPWLLGVVFVLVFAAAAAATWRVTLWLRRRAILDRPNARSSHTVPTPRGGGIGVLAALLPAWMVLAAFAPQAMPQAPLWSVLVGALLLAGISFLDDIGGVPALLRLIAHAVAVGLGLAALEAAGPVFQGLLPRWLDLAVAGAIWLWFLNLFNFMDGIDGIAGTELVCVAGGLAVVALAGYGPSQTAAPALAMAAASLGFLVWNRPPARVFMGDVGSIPLGYLLGWLLLDAAARGAWAAAVILPAYFLGDATITLGRRLARGESIFSPHAQHFYQQAVRRGLTHRQVVLAVLAGNLVLVVLAVGAERGERLAGLVAAAAVVFMVVRYLLGFGQPRLFR
jgi:UDP-N-acetylmuramyl pentapeptide phosphotransferase/UDP-N-acetylglucosamine-1-phosphate transferase